MILFMILEEDKILPNDTKLKSLKENTTNLTTQNFLSYMKNVYLYYIYT